MIRTLFIAQFSSFHYTFHWMIRTQTWLLHVLRNPHLLRSFQWSIVPVDFVEFFSIELAAYSKPPSRDNHRESVLSKNATKWPGCRLNQDHAIRVVVKTTPLRSWPCCRSDTIYARLNLHYLCKIYFISMDSYLEVSKSNLSLYSL